MSTAADGTASFDDLDIDTPGVFVITAASAGLLSAHSAGITINTGSLFSSVATGDPDWQNQIDGVDVLFQKSGPASTVHAQGHQPGHVQVPPVARERDRASTSTSRASSCRTSSGNGVSIKDANGGSTTVYLTVPSMPASIGTPTTR